MQKSHPFHEDKKTRGHFSTYQLVLKILLGSAAVAIFTLAVLGLLLL